jgi:hypothetical protein
VKKCRDQNGAFDDPNADDILESENQVVESLMQELTSEFSSASGSASLNKGEVDISEMDMVSGFAQSLSDLLDKAIKTSQGQILFS